MAEVASPAVTGVVLVEVVPPQVLGVCTICSGSGAVEKPGNPWCAGGRGELLCAAAALLYALQISTSTLVLVGHFISYSWNGHALAWWFLAPAEQDGPVPSQVSVLGLMQELQPPPPPHTEAGVSRRGRAGGYCSDPSE